MALGVSVGERGVWRKVEGLVGGDVIDDGEERFGSRREDEVGKFGIEVFVRSTPLGHHGDGGREVGAREDVVNARLDEHHLGVVEVEVAAVVESHVVAVALEERGEVVGMAHLVRESKDGRGTARKGGILGEERAETAVGAAAGGVAVGEGDALGNHAVDVGRETVHAVERLDDTVREGFENDEDDVDGFAVGSADMDGQRVGRERLCGTAREDVEGLVGRRVMEWVARVVVVGEGAEEAPEGVVGGMIGVGLLGEIDGGKIERSGVNASPHGQDEQGGEQEREEGEGDGVATPRGGAREAERLEEEEKEKSRNGQPSQHGEQELRQADATEDCQGVGEVREHLLVDARLPSGVEGHVAQHDERDKGQGDAGVDPYDTKGNGREKEGEREHDSRQEGEVGSGGEIHLETMEEDFRNLGRGKKGGEVGVEKEEKHFGDEEVEKPKTEIAEQEKEGTAHGQI